MSTSLTSTMAARLAMVGAVPREQDLYSCAGAEFYDRLVGPDRSEIREMLALARQAEGPILDVAAGSGRLTVPLVRSGRHVTAIDLSEAMLSHLRAMLPEQPALTSVVADMRDFTLDQRFGLVLLGATSITLLDHADRSRFYACVRRHLAPRGVFALTVAAGSAAHQLSISEDRQIMVPGPDGDEPYLFSQQVDEVGAVRTVNWVRTEDLARGCEAEVLTSRLHVLSPDALAHELIDAGFVVPTVSPVRTHAGDDMVLLTTSFPRGGGAERHDAGK